MKNSSSISRMIQVLAQSVLLLFVCSFIFSSFEPAIIFGATATSQFKISQDISSEISFVIPASNVTMSPSLGGLTGGTSNGSTQLVVNTSNNTGYNMTLVSSSSLGMINTASSTYYIPAYVPSSGGVPDYSFTAPANTARFGYSVKATTTSDVAQLFLDNGSNACNTGSSNTTDKCWLNASTSAVTIINRATPTPSGGATSTLFFRVVINSNPNPVIPNGTYVATTTLTATTNP